MARHKVARLQLALDGISSLQHSMQLAQRVWNLQPLGGLAGDGMLPSSTIRFIFTVGSGTGMAENRALV